MDRRECVELLLEHGADPSLHSVTLDTAHCVAPSPELKALIADFPPERTAQLMAEREQLLVAEQWRPPEEDSSDEACGEAGYSLQIGITRLADALDSIARDSDRYTLVLDLGGKATVFFQYRDVNMALVYKPSDAEPDTLRKLLLGALRFGKPFVIDMLSLALDEDMLNELLDPVIPSLLQLLLSKRICEEQHYSKLIRPSDGDEYSPTLWKQRNLECFHFVLLSKLPVAPEWCTDRMFIVKVASE